jgi:AbrB family looped-hinge helix DNA binding protein
MLSKDAATPPGKLRENLSSTLSSKCQITVPAQVRQRLGLKAGDRVRFVFDGEQTVLQPLRETNNVFAQYIGVAKATPGFDSVAWVRAMRDGELPAEPAPRRRQATPREPRKRPRTVAA